MKRNIFTSLCLCALFSVSCQDTFNSDDITVPQTNNKYKLNASTADGTRQSIHEDGIIRWTPYDYLTVFFGDRDNIVVYDFGDDDCFVETGYSFGTTKEDISEDGKHTSFTLNDEGLTVPFEAPDDSTDIMAFSGLYPVFDLDGDPDFPESPDDMESFWFLQADEEYEDYETGEIYSEPAFLCGNVQRSNDIHLRCPSIAIGKTGKPLMFHSLFGALGLRLQGNADISLIRLTDPQHEIAGIFHYDHGEITLEEDEDYQDYISNSISLMCSSDYYQNWNPLVLSDSVRVVHFFLPDGALSEGFTIEIFDSTGTLVQTVSTDKNNEIHAGEVRMMPVITVNVPATMVSGNDFRNRMANYYGGGWTLNKFDEVSFITEADSMIGAPTDLTWYDHDLTQSGGKVYSKFWTESGYINTGDPWHLQIFTADTVIRITSLCNMFDSMSQLKTIIGLENTDLSGVTDINGAFSFCNSLKSVDLSGLNPDNIIDEKNDYVLSFCWSLTDINLGNLTFGASQNGDQDILCRNVPDCTPIHITCNAIMYERLMKRIPERLHDYVEWTEVTE